ncbi:hypothetical protein SLEP1_g8429 [Rubroshorea leprosula]|uniref:Rhamnogalacturonan lyase domain-containing protein n=1 Tax=Rubroshorea leprosula TaxID=152421 RepID=A0AAV5I9Y7_9ROSI|nr:hypothetical protein SLEP1_g8429 [Rubroshorea leprosula]
MAEVVSRCHRNLVVFWMTMAVELLLLLSVCPEITPPRRTNLGDATQQPRAVKLIKENEQVVIDNGLVRVTLSTPDGFVTGIQYNGVENVDDKYQYSLEDKDNKVHGWMVANPPVGFWMITPSDEFRVGGPIKQDLNSHTGPVNLNMFVSTHYAGIDMDLEYKQGEPWKKVFGPFLVYLNSARSPGNYSTLWGDAKRQMLEEVRSWPYNFVASPDFPPADQRGQVFGQLVVADGYVSNKPIFAKGAYVFDLMPQLAYRNLGNGDYKAATWQIAFQLQNVLHTGNYTLQLALASASYAKLQVRFNDPNAPEPEFETPGRIGFDNAIARHGIHGLYRFYSIQVPSNKLRKGSNTIYLTQSLSTTPFQGVMYDYIRFEEPGQ